MLTFGKQYGVHVVANRDSPPHDSTRAYRSLARKVHPDKPGGCIADFQSSALHMMLGPTFRKQDDRWAGHHRHGKMVHSPVGPSRKVWWPQAICQHPSTSVRGSALVGGQVCRCCLNRHESLVDLITSQTDQSVR